MGWLNKHQLCVYVCMCVFFYYFATLPSPLLHRYDTAYLCGKWTDQSYCSEELQCWRSYPLVIVAVIAGLVVIDTGVLQEMYVYFWMLLVRMENVSFSHLMQLTVFWLVCSTVLMMYVICVSNSLFTFVLEHMINIADFIFFLRHTYICLF